MNVTLENQQVIHLQPVVFGGILIFTVSIPPLPLHAIN